MSAPRLEAFLARLYVDAQARASFMADPAGETSQAGLSDEERDALIRIDRIGLEMTARSFTGKRAKRDQRGSWGHTKGWIRNFPSFLMSLIAAR